MRTRLLAFMLLLIFISCKNKKHTLAGEQVELNDFIDAFPDTELPYSVSDTSLSPPADTSTISYAIFKDFIPDTVFTTQFAKDRNFTIYPVARFGSKTAETYLVAYVQSKNKQASYLLVLDQTKKFSAFLPLVVSNNDKDVTTTATIDKKYGVTLYDEWVRNETLYYQRNTYVYNNVGTFTMVLNETNDLTRQPLKEVNPIDTFPKLNKYSGDYYKGKTNFISLRDTRKADTYLFYVHFENDDEDHCSGELRGEMRLTSATTAVYRENGDPCVIDFTLSGNQVKVKEQGSCGNYRGIRCFFNDTYTRKKEPKAGKTRK